MNITQSFYDNMAARYDRLFEDWAAATREQAALLDRLFAERGFDRSARILDCACGIGTQAIGLAALGYPVTASDISEAELAQARARAAEGRLDIDFRRADFRGLPEVFSERFDIVIAMDNALPHMLSLEDLARAVRSMAGQTRPGGVVVASIRDYDALLRDRPPYSPPYIHRTPDGQRVCFQTWDWRGESYRLTQYIIEDGQALEISKYECEYRATRREELTRLFRAAGCGDVTWRFPEETGFYQPIVVAGKSE